MALGAGIGAVGGAGVGSLGTLFVRLTANSTGLSTGMRNAERTIETSTAVMRRQLNLFAKGAVAAFAIIGAAAVREFARFDQAMTKSLAIMSDITPAIRREMEATARSIARNSVTSATQAAEAYFFLASAGLNAQQSIAALPLVEKFAVAGAFDMSTATDLLTDAQSALGLTVKDTTENMKNMGRVSDVLVKANTLANATVEQFSTSLTREAGAALKSFNIDVEEGVAVLAAFADQGVKAELAGTGLSRILRLMTSAAVSNAEAYRQMNIEVFDAEGNINNLADIIEDLEKALLGMSDQERVAALETLGFAARVQGVILPLLGASEKIRGYEEQLRKAAGTTGEIADKQLQSFINQLTITWNRVKDLLLSIGEGLTPALRVFNDEILRATEATAGMEGELSALTKGALVVGRALVIIVGTISEVVRGWKLITKTGEVALLAISRIIAMIASGITKAIAGMGEMMAKGVIGAINLIIKGVNKLPDWMKPKGAENIAPLKYKVEIDTSDLDDFVEVFTASTKEAQKELSELVGEGSPFMRMVGNFDQMADKIKEANKKIVDDTKKSVDEINEKVVTARQTAEENARQAAIEAAESEILGMAKGGVGSNLGGFGLADFDFQASQQMAIANEVKLNEEKLARLKELGDQELELTREIEEKRLALLEEYEQRQRELRIAQAQFITSTTATMFEDLAFIAAETAGKQSALYRVMFAASKAFAIADSIVKIMQGVAAAASLPWPANLAAMASTIAATANIVATIQSTRLELGGARAAGGPVDQGKAFLVGERGPEMFVPRENGNIVPNDRLGSETKVVINNYTDARPQVTERNEGGQRTIEIMIRRAKEEIAGEIRDGRGGVNRAMEDSFNLRRGQR